MLFSCVEQIHFHEALKRLKQALGLFIPSYIIEHIHFQEALKRLKQALGLFITSYISRTNSFPGGSQKAETSFGPLHPLLC